LKSAMNYGLDTLLYEIDEITKLQNLLKNSSSENLDIAETINKLELICTENCFRFMSHLKSGVLYPDSMIYNNILVQYPDSFYNYLLISEKADNFNQAILNVQPTFCEYKNLQLGLEIFLNNNVLDTFHLQISNYKTDSVNCYNTAKHFLWKEYQKKQSKYLFDSIIYISFYNSISVLGFKKIIIKDLKFKNLDTIFFESLKLFQIQHGLEADGKIGKFTWQALKLSKLDMYMQIAATLERMRWESQMTDEFVLVNLPAYKLKIYENNVLKKYYKIVVGAPDKKTPTLNSEIENIITFPEWNVPFSISSKEILPKLKNDSTYLQRHNYVLTNSEKQVVNQNDIDWQDINTDNFNFKIKQRSGNANSLGTIKFVFKNKYSVYIHDTPQKGYFNNSVRAYSHGCIRLQNPIEFAKDLLRDDNQNKNADSLDSTMKHGDRRYFVLKKHKTLYIRYFTCETDNLYNIIFYTDIYNFNKKIARQIFVNYL